MMIAAVIGLVLVLLVIVFVGIPIVRMLLSSSTSIESLGDSKCNKALKQEDYQSMIVKFSPREYTSGGQNTFYEPKLAIVHFLQYIDCRNDLQFDLSQDKPKKIDDKILVCGNEAFRNYEKDITKEIQKFEKEDPGYAKSLKSEKKILATAYKKAFKNIKIPGGSCDFEADL